MAGDILNPFGKAEPKSDEEALEGYTNVCPLLSTVMPAPPLVAGGEMTTILYPTVCLGKSCAVWSTKKSRCGMAAG